MTNNKNKTASYFYLLFILYFSGTKKVKSEKGKEKSEK